MENLQERMPFQRAKGSRQIHQRLYSPDSFFYMCKKIAKIVKEQQVKFVDGKSDVEIPLTRLNEGDEEKTAVYEEALDYMQFCNATSSC